MPNTKTTPADDGMVTVRLFKDSWRYKDDVFVAVNGKGWQIRRGEDVRVPKAVAEVLENSNAQDRQTALLKEQQVESFKKASRFLAD